MIKRVELIDKREFAKAAWDEEVFIIYIAVWSALRPGLEIKLEFFLADEALTKVSPK